jgi:hypothetical protein
MGYNAPTARPPNKEAGDQWQPKNCKSHLCARHEKGSNSGIDLYLGGRLQLKLNHFGEVFWRGKMPITATRSLLLCLYFSASLMLQNSANAKTSYLLKGIEVVKFMIVVEETVGGNGCKIDQEAMNTSLQFVANQSTKLKILTWKEYVKREDDLRTAAQSKAPSTDGFFKDVNKYQAELKEYQAALDKGKKYTQAPLLIISIMPLQVGNGCGGHINAELSASIGPTQLTPTKREVYNESIKLWSEGYSFVSPQPTFSEYAINIAGQMMKQLVNDWTASQEQE